MPINTTDQWFYLDASGKVITGGAEPPEGAVTVLAAPGATIPNDVAEKYGLTDRFSDEPPVQTDAAGEPVVLVNDKAVALSALSPEQQEGYRAKLGKEAGTAAKAAAARPAESKAVAGPEENKAGGTGVSGPGTMQAAPAATTAATTATATQAKGEEGKGGDKSGLFGGKK